jgi:hypothetical protein
MEVYKLSMLIIADKPNAFGLNIGNEDLFHTIDTIANNLRHLVVRKLYTYYWYHVDGDNFKCTLTWWYTKEHRFLIINILMK